MKHSRASDSDAVGAADIAEYQAAVGQIPTRLVSIPDINLDGLRPHSRMPITTACMTRGIPFGQDVMMAAEDATQDGSQEERGDDDISDSESYYESDDEMASRNF